MAQNALTSRQTQILKTIVDEYIAKAIPVGSASLDKKYNLGVSPATIRAEMVQLTKMKYLKQPHTSSGRVPTPTAMKFYINQLMEEKQLGVAEEVKAKEKTKDGLIAIYELATKKKIHPYELLKKNGFIKNPADEFLKVN